MANWLATIVQNSCEALEDCRLQSACLDGFCVHKDLWPPSTLDVVLGVSILVLTGLANAAGIAGGALIVPLVITIGGFTAHETVPIASSAVTGGALVAAVFRIEMRHLFVDKPRIDYDIALHLLLPMLMGTFFGVTVNSITPGWTILTVLVVTLTYTTYSVFKVAVRMSHMQGIGAAMEPLTGDRETLGAEVAVIQQEEKKLAPPRHVAMIGGVFALAVVFIFLRGGKGVPSLLGFEQCSAAYWVSTGLFVVATGVISELTGLFLVRKDVYYEKVGYPFDKYDFRWTTARYRSLTVLGTFVGFASGVLVLTGGVILGPFLLALKMRPEVANATSSFMILFVCTTTFLQFATAGMVTYDYGGVFCLITALGSLIGVTVIENYIKEKQYVVVILLGVAIATAALLLPVYGVYKTMEDGGFQLSFRDFCE